MTDRRAVLAVAGPFSRDTWRKGSAEDSSDLIADLEWHEQQSAIQDRTNGTFSGTEPACIPDTVSTSAQTGSPCQIAYCGAFSHPYCCSS